MYQIVYVSSVCAELSEDDLKDVLCHAGEANRALGITGVLVYLDGCVLQVLEGERECVLDLYAKIETDPRHSGARVLIESDVAERAFPEWSMGFRKASRSDIYMAGFFALTQRALEGGMDQADAKTLRTIVKTFYRPGDVPVPRIEREMALSAA